MKSRLHQGSYARSCQEFKELKRNCYQEENIERTTKIGWTFLCSMIRNHEQWVYSSTILTYWAVMTYVPHQALSTSSSRKPSREVGMPRNTRENMSIPGNVLIVNMLNEILMNFSIYSRIWATPLGIATDVEDSEKKKKTGIENSGSEEPLQSIPLPCFSERARKNPDDK